MCSTSSTPHSSWSARMASHWQRARLRGAEMAGVCQVGRNIRCVIAVYSLQPNADRNASTAPESPCFTMPSIMLHMLSPFKLQNASGDVIYLSIPLVGLHIVVLNSLKAANDLLDRRAHNYADRPKWVMAARLLTGGYFLPLAPYGDRSVLDL